MTASLAPLLKVLLEVLLPFFWDKATARTAVDVIRRTDDDDRRSESMARARHEQG